MVRRVPAMVDSRQRDTELGLVATERDPRVAHYRTGTGDRSVAALMMNIVYKALIIATAVTVVLMIGAMIGAYIFFWMLAEMLGG